MIRYWDCHFHCLAASLGITLTQVKSLGFRSATWGLQSAVLRELGPGPMIVIENLFI